MRTQGWVIFRNNSHCPLINVRYGSDKRQERHNVLVLPDASVQPHVRAYLKIAHLGKCDLTSHANWIDLFKQRLLDIVGEIQSQFTVSANELPIEAQKVSAPTNIANQ